MAGSTADTAVKGAARRRAGVLAGLLAGPLFLISVGLNTWASIDYLHQLGWEFVGGEQVPWPSSLARGPYGWAQVATFVVTGLLIMILAIAVRDQLPHTRASSFAVLLLALLGVALMLAAFRVDAPMLSGRDPQTWNGWVHGTAFLLIIATGVLAPLTLAFVRTYDIDPRAVLPVPGPHLDGFTNGYLVFDHQPLSSVVGVLLVKVGLVHLEAGNVQRLG